MTDRQLQWLACSALFVSSLVLAGCGQSAVANRKYYLLDTVRQAPPASFHSPATLRVRPFGVDQAFAGKALVYRVAAFRYEPDFYDQFLVAPGVMVMEKTRDWLADSGLFQRVYSAHGPEEATYVLEGNVIEMYGDFRNVSAPQAIMEIRFYLQARPDADEAVVLARTYRAETPIAERTADLEKVLAQSPAGGTETEKE
jgi:cholesterol transport system auxiliary component